MKLRKAFENRAADNGAAAEILRNSRLWERLGGPGAENLLNPSRGALEVCKECLDALGELQQRDDSIDDAFAGEIRKAVGMLKSLSWDDIRTERFPLTPIGLFLEFVRNAETFVNKRAEEAVRREAWLARDDGDHDRGSVALSWKGGDRFGLDLDEFKMKTGGWLCRNRK